MLSAILTRFSVWQVSRSRVWAAAFHPHCLVSLAPEPLANLVSYSYHLTSAGAKHCVSCSIRLPTTVQRGLPQAWMLVSPLPCISGRSGSRTSAPSCSLSTTSSTLTRPTRRYIASCSLAVQDTPLINLHWDAASQVPRRAHSRNVADYVGENHKPLRSFPYSAPHPTPLTTELDTYADLAPPDQHPSKDPACPPKGLDPTPPDYDVAVFRASGGSACERD